MSGKKESDKLESPCPWMNDPKYAEMGPYPMYKPYLNLLNESAFLASMGRNVRFQETQRKDCLTAGVRYDMRLDEFVLEYNSRFMWWMNDETLKTKNNNGHGRSACTFVMKHELLHLVLGHVTGRMLYPHSAHNMATDAIIDLMCDQHGNNVPSWVIYPGRMPTNFDGTPFDIKDIAKKKAFQTIASWNPKDDHSSEWYFWELMKNASEDFEQECQSGSCRGPGGSWDSHDWDVIMNSDENGNDTGTGTGFGIGEMSREDFEEYINEKARDLVERAVRDADNAGGNGWGSIPADLQSQIRKMVSKTVNWKQLLKQFIGKSALGSRTTSIKRINRKYPYIHPGVKRSHTGKPVVYIDQSGSVGNEAIEMFFGELHGLTRLVGIDVYPFDTRVDEKDVIHWKKGGKTPEKRAYCGGTSFNAPTRHANDPMNRGRWDGMLILTDGFAPQPESSRIKRAWILAPNCKLQFDPGNETVIYMGEDGKKEFGSWK